MNKIDWIEMIGLAVLWTATAIGCIGAFFYDWKWHNLVLGIAAGWFASAIIRVTVEEYQDAKKQK